MSHSLLEKGEEYDRWQRGCADSLLLRKGSNSATISNFCKRLYILLSWKSLNVSLSRDSNVVRAPGKRKCPAISGRPQARLKQNKACYFGFSGGLHRRKLKEEHDRKSLVGERIYQSSMASVLCENVWRSIHVRNGWLDGVEALRRSCG